jgi:hypothetical protein
MRDLVRQMGYDPDQDLASGLIHGAAMKPVAILIPVPAGTVACRLHRIGDDLKDGAPIRDVERPTEHLVLWRWAPHGHSSRVVAGAAVHSASARLLIRAQSKGTARPEMNGDAFKNVLTASIERTFPIR